MMAKRDRALTENQLDAFLRDSNPVHQVFLHRVVGFLSSVLRFSRDAPLRIADLGGGDGQILDACLRLFPAARGVLVDRSPKMLAANRPDPRKTLIEADLADFPAMLPKDMTFDLIMLSFVLHHCIRSTVRETREFQTSVLSRTRDRLSHGGVILVSETLQESWPSGEIAPCMVFWLTRSRRLAPIMRSLGANTAGTGVLFASDRGLTRIFHEAKLCVVGSRVSHVDPLSGKLWLLGCRRHYHKLFVLAAEAGVRGRPAGRRI